MVVQDGALHRLARRHQRGRTGASDWRGSLRVPFSEAVEPSGPAHGARHGFLRDLPVLLALERATSRRPSCCPRACETSTACWSSMRREPRFQRPASRCLGPPAGQILGLRGVACRSSPCGCQPGAAQDRRHRTRLRSRHVPTSPAPPTSPLRIVLQLGGVVRGTASWRPMAPRPTGASSPRTRAARTSRLPSSPTPRWGASPSGGQVKGKRPVRGDGSSGWRGHPRADEAGWFRLDGIGDRPVDLVAARTSGPRQQSSTRMAVGVRAGAGTWSCGSCPSSDPSRPGAHEVAAVGTVGSLTKSV